MLKWLAKRRAPKRMARELYGRIVAQSRLAAFYTDLGVPDAIERRFELLVLHMFISLRRLRGQGGAAAGVAQHLVDLFVADMDTIMRETGVGDMAVPKKVRALAGAFHSRLQAYEAAIADDDRQALEASIARHVFGQDAHASAPVLAGYVRRALALPAPVTADGGIGDEPLFPGLAAPE